MSVRRSPSPQDWKALVGPDPERYPEDRDSQLLGEWCDAYLTMAIQYAAWAWGRDALAMIYRKLEGWWEADGLPAASGAVGPRLAQLIRERDEHRCQVCGTDEAPFQIDHIVPRSKGGPTKLENLQLLCARCNGDKGARL